MDRLVFIMLLAFSAWGTVFSQTLRESETVRSAKHSSVQPDAARSGSGIRIGWKTSLELPGKNRVEKIQSFFSSYGSDLGINPATSFEPIADQQDLAGAHHLKMAQFYQGIPVFDGHLSFHFDHQDHLRSVTGVLPADSGTDLVANLTPSDAAAVALHWLDENYPGRQASVVVNKLYAYQQGLLKGKRGELILAYYLELTNHQDIRDYLLIDAITGQLIEHIPGMCQLLHREVYLSGLNNLIWEEGDNFPSSLDTWQQNELIHSESIYHLFKNAFQYTSYDNQDGVMRIVDQAGFLPCPNATWNGYSTNYCSYMGTDDIVGHEWAHAYTEYTSNLLLMWQSGAINEAYSDIWGETLDILNGDSDVDVLRMDCENSTRWKIAEATGILSGPLRDLYSPNCHDDPGKLSDPQYYCGTNDQGGVHTNSGVVSHAYALLVDGGEYNGYTIPAIGLTKAAHIFWHTQRIYLSRTSDFKALADGLEAACNDLRGIDLPALTLTLGDTELSGQQIDASDSLALSMVIAATELRLDIDVCPDEQPALNPDAEDWCNEIGKVFYPFYTEDFEGEVSGWKAAELPVDEGYWIARQWQVVEPLPANRAGRGMFGPTPNVGDCDEQANNGIIRLESPQIIIPNGLEGHVYLTFDHYFSLENGEDGGNMKIQQDGGGWTKIPPSAFIFNAYNDVLPISNVSNNPMAGENVFSGAGQGTVTGNWGTTQIDLDIIGVREGDEIIMRWEIGTNECDGWDGWYLDNIKLGTCSSAALLPVEWLSFTVLSSPQGVNLNWTTAREANNAGFTVERSRDGRVFESLAWVDGLGDRETPTDYHFLDTQPVLKSDYLYYRLRQEDHNGDYTYSPIRKLKLERNAYWQISPNPVSNQLKLDWQNSWPGLMDLHIYNLQGQILYSQVVKTPSTLIHLERLPAGLYLLQLSGEDFHSTQRFIVE